MLSNKLLLILIILCGSISILQFYEKDLCLGKSVSGEEGSDKSQSELTEVEKKLIDLGSKLKSYEKTLKSWPDKVKKARKSKSPKDKEWLKSGQNKEKAEIKKKIEDTKKEIEKNGGMAALRKAEKKVEKNKQMAQKKAQKGKKKKK